MHLGHLQRYDLRRLRHKLGTTAIQNTLQRGSNATCKDGAELKAFPSTLYGAALCGPSVAQLLPVKFWAGTISLM